MGATQSTKKTKKKGAAIKVNERGELTTETIEGWRQENRIFRILLVGDDESERLKFLIQARLQFGRYISEEERSNAKQQIVYYVINGAKDILIAMTAFKQDRRHGERLRVPIDIITQAFESAKNGEAEFNQDVVLGIAALLDDSEFMEAFHDQSDFHRVGYAWLSLATNAVNKFPTWGGPGWIPTCEDVIISEMRTPGNQSHYFLFKNLVSEVIYVNTQYKNGRKRNIALYENIHAVAFLTSLSEYYIKGEEYNDTKLSASLNLWTEYTNHPSYKDCCKVLLFTNLKTFVQQYYYHQIPIISPFSSQLLTAPRPSDEENDECRLAISWLRAIFQVGGIFNGSYIHFVTGDEYDALIAVVFKYAADHIVNQALMPMITGLYVKLGADLLTFLL